MLKRNEIANIIADYSHGVVSKYIAFAGTAGAAVNSGWFDSSIEWLLQFPWTQTVSFIAVLLLAIERGFIVWARYQKHKRGEI